MYKQIYRCVNKEPIILFKKSKTEQSTETLEYLPGSLFRGYVATKLFNNLEDEELIKKLIFSKELRFGDAHLVFFNERSMPVPLSFHKNQLDDNTFENLAAKSDDRNKKKQVREGYHILKENNIMVAVPETGERMKAARDLANRSSKEGLMYLYKFIEPNHTFEFEIKSTDKSLLEKVNEILNHETIYLAKSKNAEFGGKVEIKSNSEIKLEETKKPKEVIRIFAASNWCFLNQFGTFTSEITPDIFGISDDTEIDWGKTFLRFRTYSPFNNHREAFDAPRLIIEKGSVVTFNKKTLLPPNIFTEGVGCFLNEGFGEILEDPLFLRDENYNFKIIENINQNQEKQDLDVVIDFLLTALNKNLESKKQNIKNYNLAADWIKENKKVFKGIGRSQWAKVYNAVFELDETGEMEKVLVNEKEGVLVKSKHTKWDEGPIASLKKILENNNAAAFKMFIKTMINQQRDV